MDVILSLLGTVLVTLIGFALGRWSEQRKHLLHLRSEEIKVIEEWLQWAEKLVGILGDTLVSTQKGLIAPVMYNLEERKKVSQYLTEKTNTVLSIIDSSKELETKQTQKLINNLTETIQELDILLKHQLLPIESRIKELSESQQLMEIDLIQAIKIKLDADNLLQKAYKNIRLIKAKLT